MKIVFIGSGAFALSILASLVNIFDIQLVITKPDTHKGRGQKLTGSIIGNFCDELGLLKLAPKTINSEEIKEKISSIGAPLAILASYSEILNQEIINTFELGIINIHPSILPMYRGAEPIRWAIRNCEKRTGVTIMMLSKSLDRGNIIAQQSEEILDDDDYATLTKRLIDLSVDMLPNAISSIVGGFRGILQNQQKTFYARRLKPKDELIFWDDYAERVSCHIRSMSPDPGCYTIYQGKRVKLFVPSTSCEKGVAPGTIIEAKKKLVVACKNSALEFAYAQREGGKKIPISDFLASSYLKIGDQFTSN